MVSLSAKTGFIIRREEIRASDQFVGGAFTEKFRSLVNEMNFYAGSQNFEMTQAARLCVDRVLEETRKVLIDAGWMTESEVNSAILKVCLKYMRTKGEAAA